MLFPLPKHFRCLCSAYLGLPFLLLPAERACAAPIALKSEASVASALADFNDKHYDEALRDLAPALESDPKNAEALNLKGAILTKQKNYDAALAAYRAALGISPGFFPARYNIGALLALRNQWGAAIDYYRNILIEQPDNELVEFKLLLLLLQTDKSPELQGKLFATDLPTNTPAWYYAMAARSYKKGDASEAAKYLDAAKNIYGDKTEIFQEELDESGLNGSH